MSAINPYFTGPAAGVTHTTDTRQKNSLSTQRPSRQQANPSTQSNGSKGNALSTRPY